MFEVRLLNGAAADLARLDKSAAKRILNRLRWLAANIDRIKREALTGGMSGLFKFRVGDYRVIYSVVDAEHVLLIHAIGHRSDIYRQK